MILQITDHDGKHLTTRFNIVWLVLVALLLPAGSRAACVTAACHADYGQAATVHAPVADRDCTSCHVATGRPHPGAESMRIIETGRKLCLTCHEEPAAGNPVLHQPIVESCLLCHGSSSNQGFPGHLVRSVSPDSRGEMVLTRGSKRVDHATPFEDRWQAAGRLLGINLLHLSSAAGHA